MQPAHRPRDSANPVRSPFPVRTLDFHLHSEAFCVLCIPNTRLAILQGIPIAQRACITGQGYRTMCASPDAHHMTHAQLIPALASLDAYIHPLGWNSGLAAECDSRHRNTNSAHQVSQTDDKCFQPSRTALRCAAPGGHCLGILQAVAIRMPFLATSERLRQHVVGVSGRRTRPRGLVPYIRHCVRDETFIPQPPKKKQNNYKSKLRSPRNPIMLLRGYDSLRARLSTIAAGGTSRGSRSELMGPTAGITARSTSDPHRGCRSKQHPECFQQFLPTTSLGD